MNVLMNKDTSIQKQVLTFRNVTDTALGVDISDLDAM